jgi:hypothetical protein
MKPSVPQRQGSCGLQHVCDELLCFHFVAGEPDRDLILQSLFEVLLLGREDGTDLWSLSIWTGLGGYGLVIFGSRGSLGLGTNY